MYHKNVKRTLIFIFYLFLIDCTRPWVLAKCNECNAQIGGLNHKLSEGNQRVNELIDNTIKGYSLPYAHELTDLPMTDRLLNSIEFQIERFFLHACLYLACGDEDESSATVLRQMKTTKVKKEDLKQFFWDHMVKNLKISCSILNITQDELIILLHLITFRFIHTKDNSLDCSFNTKKCRQNWENLFNRVYLAPYLTDFNSHIINANNLLQNINQQSQHHVHHQNSKLFFMAYELLSEPKNDYLYGDDAIWKYREIVTFNSMSIDLKNNLKLKDQFKILKKFHELQSKLNLVQFNLPPIMLLVNFLRKKSCSQHIAQNKTIGEYLNTYRLRHRINTNLMAQLKESIHSFHQVWSFIKLNNQCIQNYQSILTFNLEYRVDLNSKLSYFLPTLTGDGLFSYSFIKFLCSIQNEMLHYYHEIKEIQHTSTLSVNQFENSELVINFDQDNDLFRLVQANFCYDANMTRIFNFKNIENQLITRYLRNKPLIDLQNMEIFEYSDEINDLNIFKKMSEISLLDFKTQNSIFDEFNNINEITEALKILKVITNYTSNLLTNSSTNTTIKDQNLNQKSIFSFIETIYKDDFNKIKLIFKENIAEKCQIKHLKHVWIILMTKRSIMYTLDNQDPFQSLNISFKSTQPLEWDHGCPTILVPGTQGPGKLCQDKPGPEHESFDTESLISLLIVIFQIITFDLNTLTNDVEIGDKKNQQLNDILINLNAYNEFLIPTNMSEIIHSSDDSVSSDIDDVLMCQPIKLENIFEYWKFLCRNCRVL
jgi:hypothetical protein